MATKQTGRGGAKTPAPDTKTAVLATLPEMVPTQQDGIKILDFFNGIIAWSQRGMALEQRAKATLAEARFLKPPTSADEDEKIQIFIKRASADDKEVVEQWEITSLVSRFHKRLTSARARATTPLAEAKDIAQRLHNDYVAEANRKAALEQERVRMKAEADAAAKRQKELDDLEALALKEEAASPDLSERERNFVAGVVTGLNPSTVASMCKYKNPAAAAERLMATPKIAKAIDAAIAAALIRKQAQAVRSEPLKADVPVVKAEIGGAGSDRTRWGAEVFDLEKWRAGVLAGTIPIDTAVPHEPTLNDYGRKLHEQIDRWPGVRHTKNTRTV